MNMPEFTERELKALDFSIRIWNMKDEIKRLDRRIAFVDDVNGFIEVTFSYTNGLNFKNELRDTFIGLVSIVADKYKFALFLSTILTDGFNYVFQFCIADDLTIDRAE